MYVLSCMQGHSWTLRVHSQRNEAHHMSQRFPGGQAGVVPHHQLRAAVPAATRMCYIVHNSLQIVRSCNAASKNAARPQGKSKCCCKCTRRVRHGNGLLPGVQDRFMCSCIQQCYHFPSSLVRNQLLACCWQRPVEAYALLISARNICPAGGCQELL
jgi:hypothetical protein